jgi:PAS domain S-box-containing protein
VRLLRGLRAFVRHLVGQGAERDEAAVRASEERLRVALSSGRTVAWEWDLRRNRIVRSENAPELLGLPVESDARGGAEFTERIHPDDRERVRDAVRRALDTGQPVAAEFRLIRPDGTVLWLLDDGRFEVDERGEPVRMRGIIRDITERKAAELEAQAANRAKDEFLAVLSHELRTPLTSILGWVRMLQSRTLDRAATARALSVIERNTRLQAQLIDDLLDVSRIASGEFELDRAVVNPVTVVEAALESLRAVAQSRSLALESSLDPRAGTVWADPARLQQVVWNLLSNAIKFTPAGGRVTVRLENAGDRVRIAVEDTGKGIAPEFLPYVFDRFRQADSTHTRSHGGLGLGLTIVRELVERHGGSVRAESAGEGAGATFVVTLPASAPSPETVAPSAAAPLAAVPATGGEVAPGLDGVRVLVVDDEVDARLLFAAVLRAAGAQVTSAESAAEALALIADAKPHVLLSDIAMPGVDGYELIRRVRGLDGPIGRIPAVAVTAYARTEDQDRAMRAGFDRHLAKPVEPGCLVGVVNQLVHAAPTAPSAGARRSP